MITGPTVQKAAFADVASEQDRVSIGQNRCGSDHLKQWLTDTAYEIWSSLGRDSVHGGYHEAVALSGQPAPLPKRLRVQSRQAYCFAKASGLGWRGEGVQAMQHALRFVTTSGTRRDGLCYHVVQPNGQVVDSGPDLYDQAFFLLALAEAHRTTGDPVLKMQARQILQTIKHQFAHPVCGYLDRPSVHAVLRANPHMHLLEAALAWTSVDEDGVWRTTARELVDLCRERFVDRKTGALLEYFETDWTPIREGAKSVIEPGHLFEWTWLLRQWERISGDPIADLYEPFFDIANRHGLCPRRGIAINTLSPDLRPADTSGRLWPQTERIKANLAMAEVMAGAARNRCLEDVEAAAQGLSLYLADVRPGLWRDKMNADGSFVSEPAPASSFYHIVCAIAELSRPQSG